MFSLALVSNTRTPTDSPNRTASWVSTCFLAGSSFLFPTEGCRWGEKNTSLFLHIQHWLLATFNSTKPSSFLQFYSKDLKIWSKYILLNSNEQINSINKWLVNPLLVKNLFRRAWLSNHAISSFSTLGESLHNFSPIQKGKKPHPGSCRRCHSSERFHLTTS